MDFIAGFPIPGLVKFLNSEKKLNGLEKIWNSVISLIKSVKSLENFHLVKKCTTTASS
jgi:hypothetical protein